MDNNRDMYYGNYGYFGPPNNQMMGPMMPNMNFNDLENRLLKIENQIKRLDQRITRLETPYQSNNYNEPDSSMYMM